MPDSWPPDLEEIHRAATPALKALHRARQLPFSGREGVERDDQLTMMETMANPNKTAAAYYCAPSIRAIAAQLVPAAEMNWSWP